MKILRKISNENLLSYQRRVPKLKDLELISLVLTAEFMEIDSENHFFRHIPDTLGQKSIIDGNVDWLVTLMKYD